MRGFYPLDVSPRRERRFEQWRGGGTDANAHRLLHQAGGQLRPAFAALNMCSYRFRRIFGTGEKPVEAVESQWSSDTAIRRARPSNGTWPGAVRAARPEGRRRASRARLRSPLRAAVQP